MGFFDWIMKGIGFDAEEEDGSEQPKKTKTRKQKKYERQETSQDRQDSKMLSSDVFSKPAFSENSESAFTSSGSTTHNAQPTTFGGEYNSINTSVGGFGSKTFVFFKPKNYEEVKSLINYLKQGEPAIINLDDISDAEAQRILDFISGAVCALTGTIQRISGNIFLLAPEGYNIMLDAK